MIAELMAAVMWVFGAGDKAALQKYLQLDQAVKTGGYQKQIETCVWPHRCAEDDRQFMVAEVPVTTCVWPNTCSMN